MLNEFSLILSGEQEGLDRIDEVWLIKGDSLHTNPDDEIGKGWFLKKVNLRKEKRLFPDKEKDK